MLVDMALEINGAFVGQCGREVLWEEMNSKDLALLLQNLKGRTCFPLNQVSAGCTWISAMAGSAWWRAHGNHGS